MSLGYLSRETNLDIQMKLLHAYFFIASGQQKRDWFYTRPTSTTFGIIAI